MNAGKHLSLVIKMFEMRGWISKATHPMLSIRQQRHLYAKKTGKNGKI
jgi:hypothetical protein